MVKPIREGYHSITPHMAVKGAAKYIDFLKRAFGAMEVGRTPGPDGRLMHAVVRIGDSMLMFSDLFPEYGSQPLTEGNWPIVLHLAVPDVDETFAEAVAAGCQVTMPLSDQFWGDRYGHVRDPFGFTWALSTHKEDLTAEQIKERQDAMFASRV